jgi:hypothetical protein
VEVDECSGVRVDPEGFKVRLEELTDEDGSGTALECEDGGELGLDLGEGYFGDA